jgi:histidinol-phosphate aminotransferase
MKLDDKPLYVNLNYQSDFIRLAQNENPYGASPKVIEAITKNMNCTSLYPDVVLFELKDKLAQMCGFTSSEITVGPGSCSLIDQLIFRGVRPDENIIIPKLTFSAYKLCANIHSREYREAEMDNFHISLKNIFDLCDSKTKLIFLSNPNNPTGTIFTHDEIIEFLNKVPERTYVILDEAYNEYVTDVNFPKSFDILKKYKNVIILRSFSKIYGLAGLRIGYGIAQANIIEDLEKTRIPFSVSTIANIAALTALEDVDHVRECAAKNATVREVLRKGIAELGYNVVPSQSNFIFIHFSSKVESDKMYQRLLENKIIVRKMDAFGDNSSLRISIGRHEENCRILECLK